MSTDRSFSKVIGVARAPVARGLVAAAILGALAGGACSSQPAAGSGVAAGAVTELPAGYARLAHGVHPAARLENDRGPLDPAKHIANLSLVFKLSPAQLADREALKEALVDPKSPHFRQFLTTSEYAARFGAARADIERTKTWLGSQGLEVHEDSPLGARVTFSGTASALEAAFRTEMRTYEVRGETHYAMRVSPALPSDLGELVAEITNTHDFHPKPMLRRPPAPVTPDYTSGKATGFALPDWANVYDVASLYGKGITGTGVTIGIVGVAQIAQNDVTAWRSTFGIAASPITMTLVPNTGAAQAGKGGAGFEAMLDVEWSGGLAYGATVNYVYTGAEDGNVDDATYYAIENNLTSVLSESWGGCEGGYTQAGYGPADQNVIAVYGSAANVLGITYVASSGDAGAAGCADEGISGIYAVVPAAYPGVTSVGGTQFPKGSVSGTPYFTAYGSGEAVWDESSFANAPASGGGGISVLFNRPSYQSAIPTCTAVGSLPVSGINPANQRQVPDVAFTAAEGGANTVGDLMECTIIAATQDCSPTGGNPKFSEAGGTSFAAPSFAGVVALMVQAAGGRLGNINPLLYGLATSTPTAFHDITLGANEIACTPGTDNGCPAGGKYGYAATTGYDCGAGLGSMDVAVAVNAIAGETATTTSLAVSPTSTTEGTPVNFTATVAVPHPNAQNLGGVVTFAFESYDAMSQLDLSWTLGTGTITSGTTAGGMAVFSGAVPPGLVKPGMQSVDLVAMYGGDATHLPSTSAKIPLAFGPISFSISPAMPTVKPGGTLTFTSMGGVAPVRWYTGSDTTCNTQQTTCSSIVENTGLFTAGPVSGTTMISAIDAEGAEANTTVNVVCVPATTCAAGLDCGTGSDGCGGTITCGTCTAPQTCGGTGENNVCGCPAATTCPSGDACGMAPDGCGGMVMCGTCPTGQTCSSNQCVASSSSSSSSSSAASSSGAGGTGTGGGESSSSSSSGGGTPVVVKGCSCRTAGDPLETPGTPLAAFGMLALAGAMRSRKRRSAETASA